MLRGNGFSVGVNAVREPEAHSSWVHHASSSLLFQRRVLNSFQWEEYCLVEIQTLKYFSGHLPHNLHTCIGWKYMCVSTSSVNRLKHPALAAQGLLAYQLPNNMQKQNMSMASLFLTQNRWCQCGVTCPKQGIFSTQTIFIPATVPDSPSSKMFPLDL